MQWFIFMEKRDEEFMKVALEEAELAYQDSEVPVGAVIVFNNEIIAKAHNEKETNQNPVAHAEILAIERASKVLKSWRLSDCQIYITLEPCLMCSGAILESRINKIVYGAKDLQEGSLGSVYNIFLDNGINFSPKIFGGVCANESKELLKKFFEKKRKNKNT